LRNHTHNLTVKQSMGSRVPEHEPWGGHAEQDNIVASQAPGKLGAISKDHNISDQKTNAATGSAIGSTQPDPVQNPNTSVGPTQVNVDTNINPRTGKPWSNS